MPVSIAVLMAIAIVVSSYSVSIAGTVRIPITLRIQMPTVVATVRIGVSIAAVAAIVAVRVVRIASAAAETTCGQRRNHDPSERHRHFSRVNRFHMFARRFGGFLTDPSGFVDDTTRGVRASFLVALVGTAFERS